MVRQQEQDKGIRMIQLKRIESWPHLLPNTIKSTPEMYAAADEVRDLFDEAFQKLLDNNLKMAYRSGFVANWLKNKVNEWLDEYPDHGFTWTDTPYPSWKRGDFTLEICNSIEYVSFRGFDWKRGVEYACNEPQGNVIFCSNVPEEENPIDYARTDELRKILDLVVKDAKTRYEEQ